ncbi:hypothetical protein ACL7TT_14390 [Microbulbifer sp. 2304DJ12-6]
MRKHQSQPAPADYELRPSPIQYVHFTEGDDRFIKGPKGTEV